MHRILAAAAALIAAPAVADQVAGPPASLAASPKPVIACDGNERNLETYRKMHQVLFMERDGSRVAEFYAPRVLSHDLDSGGGAPHEMGHAQLAAMWAASRRNNPDRVLADDLIICQGPYVVVRTTVHGSDAAGVGGQPPTGRRYTISAIDIYRFEDSKVVERWGNVDMLGMLRQLGLELRARPTTGAAPADGRPGAPPPR